MSIKKMLETHRKNERLSLHMPGHKGVRLPDDTTELVDTDDLLAPYADGEIAKFIKGLENIYGTSHIYPGTNGSTGCLGAAMMASGEGKKVVLPRGSHQSIYQGIISNGLEPVYLREEVDTFGVPECIRGDAYLPYMKEGDTFIFYSPTFYGRKEDYQLLKPFMKDKTYILDAAHGAHFTYLFKEWNQWMTYGSVSVHKMLGGLNQTALLFANGEGNVVNAIERCIPFYQTTSPSFPLLRSMEDTYTEIMKMDLIGKERKIEWMKGQIGEIEGFALVRTDDPWKLILTCDQKISMKAVEGYLRREYGIYFELATEEVALGLMSFYQTDVENEWLIKSLKKASHHFKLEDDIKVGEGSIVHIPEMKVLPKEGFHRERELVDVEKAVGRVSASFYIPYPPGVPLLVPGEVIDEFVVESIVTDGEEENHYHGDKALGEGKIFVLK